MIFADKKSAHAEAYRRLKIKTWLLASLIICGLGSVAALSHAIDSARASYDQPLAEDSLYLSPTALKRMSLGLNALVADYYWLRTIQYVGRKIMAHRGSIPLGDLRELDLKLLVPLLDRTVTLDPQFIGAYEYGAIILPGVDMGAAVNLTKRGIAANPQAWRLYHHLGYIYWQSGRFKEAGEVYLEGASVRGAPRWMSAMAARMQAEGGSRETARAIYTHIYEEANEQSIKNMAFNYLLWLRSLDERDLLRRALRDHQARTGRCPGTWREVRQELHAANDSLRFDATGAPLDPSGEAYEINTDVCEATLNSNSKIPRK